jgi:hypothetical protein
VDGKVGANSAPARQSLEIASLFALLLFHLLERWDSQLLDEPCEIVSWYALHVCVAHHSMQEGVSGAIIVRVMVAFHDVVGTRLGYELIVSLVQLLLDLGVVDEAVAIAVKIVEELVDFLLVEVLRVLRVAHWVVGPSLAGLLGLLLRLFSYAVHVARTGGRLEMKKRSLDLTLGQGDELTQSPVKIHACLCRVEISIIAC